MIVYKVVFVSVSGRMESYAAFGKWARAYRLKRVTTPVKGTKLLAFRTLEQAKAFRGMPQWYRAVLKCEAGEAKPMRKGPFRHADIGAFWKGEDVTLSDMPKGTVACAWIKPLEVIE